ncbi:MAG: RHS repeat domain-containing protein [Micromonosporaceae bacterium]
MGGKHRRRAHSPPGVEQGRSQSVLAQELLRLAEHPTEGCAMSGTMAYRNGWRRHAGRRVLAGTLAAVLAATLFEGAAWADPWDGGWEAPAPQRTTRTPVKPAAPARAAPDRSAAKVVHAAPKVAWPKAATAAVNPPAVAARADVGTWAAAAGMPVRLAARDKNALPGRVKVEILDRKYALAAGVDGVLLRVTGGSGKAGRVAVAVDYSGFAGAYGGAWGSRLQLLRLPVCAAATPAKAACQGSTVVGSRNNSATSLLVADVDTSEESTLLAVTAAASGDTGTYKATSLSPSAAWDVSASTGDFSWSYPIRTPPSPGGAAPEFALSYSSGSVDGRSAASNNQVSWIGEGFDLAPGSIERRYKPCADDRTSEAGAPLPNNATRPTGDLCWGTYNATLSLNGRATELVQDDATGNWRLADDDGSRIELLADPNRGNGDDNNEYWKLTTVDGTIYYFGRHKLPNWGEHTSHPVTHSVWTVPVYGNHPGEPCYNTSFASSYCTQAWRWSLDHVIDPHNNTTAYYYSRDPGYYGRNNDPSLRTFYVKAGFVDRVEYGMRFGQEYTKPASAKVSFLKLDRCLPNTTCLDSGGKAIASSWPDTPWDQYCYAAPCTGNHSPTFWTRYRLSKITTHVWDAAATTPGFRDVEKYVLRHQYLDTGANDAKPMWLKGITHTGLVGGSVAMPEITLDGISMPNRVDGPDYGYSMLSRYRIQNINNETGGQTVITYSGADCNRATRMPASPDSNTLRCYPIYWTPPGQTRVLDWNHKYVATQVNDRDLVGGNLTAVTSYEYYGGAAWHYDSDENFVPAKDKTWSQWRGYGKVVIRKGTPDRLQSVSENFYLRGMDGDKLANGSTRNVTVTASTGEAIEDHRAWSGFLREEILHSGSSIASKTLHEPWLRGPTAKRTRSWGTFEGWITRTAATTTRTALEGGAWRTTKTATAYDTLGMPTTADDFGDTSTSADDRCARNTYARNNTSGMLDRVSRVETVKVACSATPARPTEVLADVRTYYDGSTTWGAAPTQGDVTKIETVDSWSGTTPVYVTTSQSQYDALGRLLQDSDALNRVTTTSYAPATGPVTHVEVTNITDPESHVNKVDLEPAWGQPTTTINAAGKSTNLSYDPLGRVMKVWLPGRLTTQTPNLEFGYSITRTAPTAVWTKTLTPGGGYLTSYELFDGLLRERQTQTQAAGGGRVLTDVRHDARGLIDHTNNRYFDTGAPSGTLVTPATVPPSQTDIVYDGAERVTAEIFLERGTEKWRTTTSYSGDRTHVTPPIGDTATTTISDARGNIVELRQYHGPTPAGSYDTMRYGYTPRDELASVTDNAGNTWRYTYDMRGRKIKSEDPDAGTTTIAYDAAGQVTSTTNARNITLAYSYDKLGRKTGVYRDSTTGTRLAEWTYDTLAKGYPTSSTRYVGSDAYTTAVTGYDEALRPTGASVTLPAAEGALAGTYTVSNTYNADGSIATTTLPAAGDLAAEKLYHSYDDVGNPTKIYSALNFYVFDASYSSYSELNQRVLGDYGARTWLSDSYNEATGRLTTTTATPELKPEVTHLDYSYDPAGNVTRVADTATGGTADTQCFSHDHLRRLTEAWTPTSGDCAAARTAAALGGAAPYWDSYTYDTTGNRTTETRHGTAGDTTRTYTYPAPATGQPHTLRSIATNGPDGTRTDSYNYDPAGNTTSRPGANGAQALTWDTEGHLASVTENGKQTSYIYDADGNRLIRRDPTGTTAYLPGGTELHLDTTGAKTCTRYYNHAGATIAVRSASKLTWLVPDHHGTAQTSIDATTLEATYRRMTPFGQPRGGIPAAWAGQRGFVDGTLDPSTGLTHLGAREYDPDTGRFISVDPIIDYADPQQLHGYAYANNNPITWSDPSGLIREGGTDSDGNSIVDPDPPSPSQWSPILDNSYGDAKRKDYEELGMALAVRRAYLDYLDNSPECKRNPGACEVERRAVDEAGIYDYEATYNSMVRVQCGFTDDPHCLSEYGYKFKTCVLHQQCPQPLTAADDRATEVGLLILDLALLRGAGTAVFASVKALVKMIARRLAAARGAPRVIMAPNGVKLPGVPKGAAGRPVQSGKGLLYEIPRGTPELDPRVTHIRVMQPVTTEPYQAPNGYVVYMNKMGQTVHPYTGQVIPPNHPFAHIRL